MELCLYNTVLTAMSYDGKAFTYDNQLASSDKDLSKRSDWFTVACCPPNMLRLLGSIGGYVWNVDQSSKSATVTVNLYISSTLEASVGGDKVRVSQQSEWPAKGDVAFAIEAKDAAFDMKLRIPQWAESHEIVPSCPNAGKEKGYLHLPAEWLSKNRNFTLKLPLTPRWITPHPYTGQDTLTLARGPVVYCVEDVDNSWVDDHFKVSFTTDMICCTMADE